MTGIPGRIPGPLCRHPQGLEDQGGDPPPHHEGREAALYEGNEAAQARSRLAAILLDMPKSSMKPFDSDWSKVSPVSYVARLKS